MAVAEIAAIIARARSVFDPRRVRKDQPYRLETMIDGSVRRFEYEIDNDRCLRVTRADGGGLREYLHLSSIAVRAGASSRATSSDGWVPPAWPLVPTSTIA